MIKASEGLSHKLNIESKLESLLERYSGETKIKLSTIIFCLHLNKSV